MRHLYLREEAVKFQTWFTKDNFLTRTPVSVKGIQRLSVHGFDDARCNDLAQTLCSALSKICLTWADRWRLAIVDGFEMTRGPKQTLTEPVQVGLR